MKSGRRAGGIQMMVAGAGITISATAWGQSLLRDAEVAPVAQRESSEQAALAPTSLFYVEPPEPRTYQKHDLVTILIDEVSKQTANQKVETKKDYKFDAALNKFPSLKAFLDGELKTGDSSPIVETGLDSTQDYKGEGKYDRSDRFSAKIQAEVIDVKPNGTLVLEARKTITKDTEKTTLVLSGKCRSEDITTSNTVLSSQLADLTLDAQNEGDVKDAGEKGLIPRIIEALFNF